MKFCNTLFLLYLDVEEPFEKKKEGKTHKVREVTEGLLLWVSIHIKRKLTLFSSAHQRLNSERSFSLTDINNINGRYLVY